MSLELGLVAISGWVAAAILFLVQKTMREELDRLRRFRNAAKGRGYYTRAEVDEALDRVRGYRFNDYASSATDAQRRGPKGESPTTEGGEAQQ